MKKVLVAAALMLCAVGANASNFRGADQVYIPIAGHSGGGSGTFITDLYLANLTGDAVSVSVIYQPLNLATNPADPNSIGQEIRDAFTLQPFERKQFLDFFPNNLGIGSGFGLVILNGCKQGTNCGEGGSPLNYRAISAETRIYLRTNNPGTTAQLFSAIPWYHFVSMLASNVGLDEVFITGVTHTANSGTGFRSNIGLANASQWSTTTLRVGLYKGGYNPLSPATNRVKEVNVTLTPLENTQKNIPALFGADTPFGEDYFVVVKQIASTPVPTTDVPADCDQGCPAFVAYGSMLDNISGDAITLEAQYNQMLSEDGIKAIYPNASGSGKASIRRAVRH